MYDSKNIAAYLGQNAGRRDTWLWNGGSGISGSDLKSSGFVVQLWKVPTESALWTAGPYEAQYLKIYDVTPPPSPAPLAAKHYTIGSDGIFTWTHPGGPDDNITKYLVNIGTTAGGNDLINNAEVIDGSNTINFSGSFGTTYYATVTSVSAVGISASSSGSSDSGAPNPTSLTTPIILLDPIGDQDHDGQSNAAEAAAMTDPLDGTSFFAVSSIKKVGTTVTVKWESKLGVNYILQSWNDLTTNDWTDVPGPATVGTGSEVSASHNILSTDAHYYYRVRTDP
jgi:hypothetical protein